MWETVFVGTIGMSGTQLNPSYHTVQTGSVGPIIEATNALFKISRGVEILVVTFSQDIAVGKKQLVFSCQRYQNVLRMLSRFFFEDGNFARRAFSLWGTSVQYGEKLDHVDVFLLVGVSFDNGTFSPRCWGDMKPQL